MGSHVTHHESEARTVVLCPLCNGFLCPRYEPYTAYRKDMKRPHVEHKPTDYLPEVSAAF